MSALVKLRVIPGGYRVIWRGQLIGHVRRVEDEWQAFSTLAPLDVMNRSLRAATRAVIDAAKCAPARHANVPIEDDDVPTPKAPPCTE